MRLRAEQIRQWETALREQFPAVIVRENVSVLKDDDLPLLDVFNVSDNAQRTFVRFMISGARKLARERGLPNVGLIPHSRSATLQHYPDVITEYDARTFAIPASCMLYVPTLHGLTSIVLNDPISSVVYGSACLTQVTAPPNYYGYYTSMLPPIEPSRVLPPAPQRVDVEETSELASAA